MINIAKDENIQWEELAVAVQRISNGVICLVSALNFYELTDEMMKEYWVAVPQSNPHTHFPKARVVLMRNMTLGVQKKKIANIDVKIFDVERSVGIHSGCSISKQQ